MDRLTTRSSLCDGCPKEDWCHQDCFESQLYERLAHYEDLEEAGRLVELPCKPYENVWRANPKAGVGVVEVSYISKADILFDIEDGWIIENTREEAEARLAGKGGGSDEAD